MVIISESCGFPSVNVPVLSTTNVFTFSRISSASAFLIRMPSVAPRPTPTMIDIGVAKPSAQGHAMISTETALTIAKAMRGSGPKSAQTTNVNAATTMTARTKYADTVSTSRWIGARVRCASLTIRTIWASKVSLPTRCASNTALPVPFTVPPVTLLPLDFSTGIGSPVIIDSSIEVAPSTTTPSTGTFSPGRTRKRSPTLIRSNETSSSLPSW